MTDNANTDPISNALGIQPISDTKISEKVQEIIIDAHDDSALSDFETARANLYNVIDTTKDAIDKLSQIADSSQNPRAFEVLSDLVKSNIQANKELLELQSKIRDIKNKGQQTSNKAQKTINNNMFVGSTSDLQKMLAEMKENNK